MIYKNQFLSNLNKSQNDDGENMDAEAVKQAVAVAVRTWNESHDPKG